MGKSKCTFCGKELTFSIKEGAKVLDAPCDCNESKEYFSAKAVKARADAEAKEAKRVGVKA